VVRSRPASDILDLHMSCLARATRFPWYCILIPPRQKRLESRIDFLGPVAADKMTVGRAHGLSVCVTELLGNYHQRGAGLNQLTGVGMSQAVEGDRVR
jgi:hypothetical protein